MLRARWIALAFASVVGAVQPAQGQGAANPSLAVHVGGSLRAKGASDSVMVLGAGIVVAVDGRSVIVVTARHVVTLTSGPPADTAVCVTLRGVGGSSCIRATIAMPQDTTLDLAVLRATLPSDAGPPVTASALHGLLGAPDRLEFGHPLEVIGCPADDCGQRIAEPQLFEGLTVSEIVFHTTSLEKGNSGGPLFNQWGEVVGMVVTQGQARAHAVRMDVIISQLKDIGIVSQLDPPPYPRAGYSSTVSASVLAVGKQGHAPSARLTLDRQLGTMVSWHVGGLRLAPANISLDAAVGGFSFDLRRGRVTVSPFAEGAIGQVDAQYDAGGHFVDAASGPRYVPFWHALQGSALGGGIGLSAQAIVARRLAVEGVVGKWRFSTPELSPALPRFSGGIGLRWALGPR